MKQLKGLRKPQVEGLCEARDGACIFSRARAVSFLSQALGARFPLGGGGGQGAQSLHEFFIRERFYHP